MSENKSNTIKAEAATIQIGEKTIDCYQMPDGSYRFSMQQVSNLVGYDKGWLSKVITRAQSQEVSKSLKPKQSKASISPSPLTFTILKEEGFSGQPIEVKTPREDRGYITAKTISLEDVQVVITHAAFNDKKPEALGLARALLIETLERRADAAFGIKRSEEERNQRLAQRVKRITAWVKWTDVIKSHLEKQGKTGESAMYKRLTWKANMSLFGVPNFSYNRDNMTLDQQITIESFETFLVRLSHKNPNLTPDDLMDKALAMFC